MTDTLFWHTARGIAANIVLMDDVWVQHTHMKFTYAIQISCGLDYFKAHISKWRGSKKPGYRSKKCLKTHYACDFGIGKPISKIKFKGWRRKIF